MRKLTIWTVLMPMLALLAGGCDRAPEAEHAGPAPAWLSAQPLTGAVEITDAKATVQAGDTVTLRGRIGGRRDPISAAQGTLVLVDPSLPSCADTPGDNCPTPWDYCCEPRDILQARSATVQLVDAQGAPVAIPEGLLKPLDEVVVQGTAGPRPDAAVLLIRATLLHRKASK